MYIGTYQVNYQSTCSARYWVSVMLDGQALGSTQHLNQPHYTVGLLNSSNASASDPKRGH